MMDLRVHTERLDMTPLTLQEIEALIAGDGTLARHRMMTHLEDVARATGPRRPPARAKPTAAGPVTAAG